MREGCLVGWGLVGALLGVRVDGRVVPPLAVGPVVPVVAPLFVGGFVAPLFVGAEVGVCDPATVATEMPNGLKGKLGGNPIDSMFLML
jgi:hypothetical protein